MLPTGIANSFEEFVILLLLAVALGAISLRLRQPLIAGFIALGILAGPSGLGLVEAEDEVHLLAEIGLALLLFVVGLRLDVGLIRSMGKVAFATGLGQVTFTTIFGYLICLALGMNHVTALYVSIALTFSSTVIIVKLLSDKHETDSLHGRIAIGLLIVQDMLVIAAMIALTAFSGDSHGSLTIHVLAVVGRGMILLALLGMLMYFVLPRLMGMLAQSQELLVLFAIAWAVGLASIGEAIGFSKEVGAFLGGVSLASTQYRDVLGARLVSLRDFLLLFFFVDLGLRLDIGSLGSQVWASIPLSLFVLIGNPLIMMVILGVMGYRKRTGLLSGVLIAQISEFSLILMALGLKLGHIHEDAVGLVTLVGLTTIGISSYMILYSDTLYEKLSPYLGVFERKTANKEQAADADLDCAGQAEIILFGIGRYGTSIARQLMLNRRPVLGIDFDPQAVKRWNDMGWKAWYGDAEDPEFPATLPLNEARWVISSVPDRSINTTLIQSLRHHGYTGSIAITMHTADEASARLKESADAVFVPFTDAASYAVEVLSSVEEKERKQKVEKTIAEISSHYIVCGYGRMGQQIVKDFQHHNVPYVVVESNPEQLPKLIEQGVPYVEGNASEDKTLLSAGIKRAKGLIAVTSTDEENVFIVLSARGLNTGLFIVARSILEENEDKLRRAGANRVMSPYILGGHRMAAAVLKPRAMDFLDILVHSEHIDLELRDLPVKPSSQLVGKTIADSGMRQHSGVLALAVRRSDGETFPNPGPDFVLNEGDEVVIMGTSEQLDAAEKFVSKRR